MEVLKVTSMEIFEKIVELQKEVWKFSDQECLPSHILLASSKTGGLILGYFEEGEIVGFSQTLISLDDKLRVKHYLHALGVKPDSRAKNVGFAIMKAHRILSMEQGINSVQWTFDPLESINANLYIKKLGAHIEDYVPNYYGSNLGGINDSIATDRFLVSWDFHHAKTIERIEGKIRDYSQKIIEEDFVIISVMFASQYRKIEKSKKFAIEVPTDFQNVKEFNLKEAIRIRLSSREIFMKLKQIQKRVSDFVLIDDAGMKRAYYLTD